MGKIVASGLKSYTKPKSGPNPFFDRIYMIYRIRVTIQTEKILLILLILSRKKY
jgi:hypothetical protein